MTLADLLSRRPCASCDGHGWEDFIDGAKLREAREAAGLKAWQVAKRMKISAPYLSTLENGKRPITETLAARYLSAIKGG